MAERLTSLSATKLWLGITDTSADPLLRMLIDGASQLVLNYIGRETFTARSYTDTFRGNGKPSMILKNWPVISITSVFVAGATINASNFGSNALPTSGYSLGEVLEGPGSLDLNGYAFYNGSPSQVTYRAGYQTTERFTIGAPPTITTARGQWIANVEVLDGSVAMTQVMGTPAAGQYAIDENGVYTFNAANAGAVIDITFNYAPDDIANATMEIVGEAYRRKDRIGQISKSLGGQETVSFSQKDMHDSIKLALNPYRRVVPV